jgi:hypothetical protein
MSCILNITDFEGRDPTDRINGSTTVSSDSNNTANSILGQSDLIEEFVVILKFPSYQIELKYPEKSEKKQRWNQ